MRLEVGFKTRPYPGEVANGDAVFVINGPDRSVIAVIDGLGHGPAAAEASERAVRFLNEAIGEVAPVALLDGLDSALKGTRGAAATICTYDGESLSYGGVGNVGVRSEGTRLGLVPCPGVLGRGVRRLRSFSTPLRPGDRFAVFSDGISARLDLASVDRLGPEAACHALVERFGREVDDASIVIADVLEDQHD